MTPGRTSMTALEWGMLGALSLVWGGSFFFNEVALSELPTFTVVVGRVVLAALILLVVMRLRGEAMPVGRDVLLAFLLMGVLNNVIPFSLIVWGQTQIASGLAAILNATTPLFTVLVAQAFTSDEKLTAPKIAGVLLGIAGVVVIMGESEFGGALLGKLAILGAAVSYGFAVTFGKTFRRRGISPMATATGQVCGSSLVMIPLWVAVDQPWTLSMPSLPVWGALIGIASISTAFAYILYFRILSTAGATNLSLVTVLVPVSAILLGAVFLGEALLPQHFAGMALIAAGLAVMDGRVLRVFGSREAPR